MRHLAIIVAAVLPACTGLVAVEPAGPAGPPPPPMAGGPPPPPVPPAQPRPPRAPVPPTQLPPPRAPAQTGYHVPPDRVPPRGSCKVWFEGLPPDRQSPPMSCGKARADAAAWGGTVIWAADERAFQTGEVAALAYGPHGLGGVPPDRLPPPGLCRLWNDQAPPDRQASPTSCRDAIAERDRRGGRVLYLPGSDL